MALISGSVSHSEQARLPEGAQVVVTLEDVSRMDVAAPILGQSRVPASGEPPFGFVIEYDEAAVHQRMTYALRARIEAEGRLLFTSTERILAFARDPAVPIMLVKVGAGFAHDSPAERG